MTVSKRLRYEVFRRDGHRCIYCGAGSKEAKLTIDHVVPEALGGTDDVGNLVAACSDCNAGKSSVNADEEFVAKVNEDATRWQRAMAAAVRIRRVESEARSADIKAVEDSWNQWTVTQSGKKVPMPVDWRTSVESLLVAGLPIEDLVRLISVAMQAKTRTNMDFPEWRYYMGCCKRVLGDIEKTARELVDAKDAAVAVEIGDSYAIPRLEDLP